MNIVSLFLGIVSVTALSKFRKHHGVSSKPSIELCIVRPITASQQSSADITVELRGPTYLNHK